MADPATADGSAFVETGESRDGAHAAGAVVAHGEGRNDGFGEVHGVALGPGCAGDAVGDLLPAGSVAPFSAGTETVFTDIYDALSSLLGQFYQLLRSVSQPLHCEITKFSLRILDVFIVEQ